ncbi:unnamed protein product, partial [Mesorhabditis spiculigera]
MSTSAPLADLEIVKTIGLGSFNRVQLVKNRKDGRYYALKVMNMAKIISINQINYVHQEKALLAEARHPFIVSLYHTAKNDRNLYLCTEFLSGGELYTHLYTKKVFSFNIAQFFAAEIAAAFTFLHGISVVYRDLKPENLVLSEQGHVKLTDFGFAKKVAGKTFTLCGTAEYLAPEVVTRSGHSFPVDWWALGILTYEMLTGQPPFQGANQEETYDQIQRTEPRFSDSINAVSRSFISDLLEKDPSRRLGTTDSEVKQHPFFTEINFGDLEAGKVQPPIVPHLEREDDTLYFPPFDESDIEEPPSSQRDRDLFAEW